LDRGLFAQRTSTRTVQALVASQQLSDNRPNAQQAAQKRLSEVETRLRRLQALDRAGVDPAVLVDAINEAQATLAAAHAELENRPAPNALTHAEVYAMVDSRETWSLRSQAPTTRFVTSNKPLGADSLRTSRPAG
jgi:uncharacterized protein YPO0396